MMAGEESAKLKEAGRTKVGFMSESSCGASKAKKKGKKKGDAAADPSKTKTKKKKKNQQQQQQEEEQEEKSGTAVLDAILKSSPAAMLEQAGKAAPAAPETLVIFPARPDGSPAPLPTTEELLPKLQRPIQQTNDPSVSVRRRALQGLADLFLVQFSEDMAALPSGAIGGQRNWEPWDPTKVR